MAELFLEAVVEGHSAKTLELVTAVQASESQDPLLLALKADLAPGNAARGAASRNRFLRRWLEEHRDEALEKWQTFGFPELRQLETPIISRAIVFDFDQVLSIHETGLHNLTKPVKFVFGGAERVATLDALFSELVGSGFTLAIVSRNSKHLIEKALGMKAFSSHVSAEPGSTDLLQYFTTQLIFGWEDYGDEVPKSEVIRDRIMRPSNLDPKDVLFIDDMFPNIFDVRGQCGADVVHVKGGGGMATQHLDAIRAWAAQHAQKK